MGKGKFRVSELLKDRDWTPNKRIEALRKRGYVVFYQDGEFRYAKAEDWHAGRYRSFPMKSDKHDELV